MPIPINRPILPANGAYPWADEVIFMRDLAGSDYVLPSDDFNGIGDQATFDIFTDGQTDRGLRVTFTRASLPNLESNGFAINVAVGTTLSTDLDVDSKTLDIVLAPATIMSQLKTSIDAHNELTSAYFGGETGTGATDAQEIPDSSGGTLDQYCYVRVFMMEGSIFVFSGVSAPSNDEGSVLIRNVQIYMFRMRKGHRVWLKRVGANDIDGSIELWYDGTGD